MICPYCGADQSSCIDSRQRGLVRIRRYDCAACGERYYTREKTVTKNFRVSQVEKELKNTKIQTVVLRKALMEAVKSCDRILESISEKEVPEE